MARLNRCAICDYTEANGSGYAGVNPGAHGRVRWVVDEFLCDTCLTAVVDNYASLITQEQKPEEGEVPVLEQLEPDTPAVPLW